MPLTTFSVLSPLTPGNPGNGTPVPPKHTSALTLLRGAAARWAGHTLSFFTGEGSGSQPELHLEGGAPPRVPVHLV